MLKSIDKSLNDFGNFWADTKNEQKSKHKVNAIR